MNIEDDIIKEIFVDDKKILLVSENKINSYGNFLRKNFIMCFSEPENKCIWLIDDVKDCSWWQHGDLFVDVKNYFYVQRDNAPGYDKIFKVGKFRGITFQGFSYEISINDGTARYFDFHK